MPSKVSSLLRKATRKPGERASVLTFPTHETYQGNLKSANADFYLIHTPGMKEWNNRFRPLPLNHVILNDEIPEDLEFDFVLSQNRFAQYAACRRLADAFGLPLISLEHCMPLSERQGYVEDWRNELKADEHVFITECNRHAWGYRAGEANVRVIEHGIDCDLFNTSPYAHRPIGLLTVGNQITTRPELGWEFMKEVMGEDLPIVLVGDCPDLGSAPARSLNELVGRYQSSRIFVNCTSDSTIPMSLLEAMACGCCVVSRPTCGIPSLITNGVNGFLCETPEGMRNVIKALINDHDFTERVGSIARLCIQTRYHMNRFTDQWNELLGA